MRRGLRTGKKSYTFDDSGGSAGSADVSSSASSADALSVTAVTRRIKSLLENELGRITVEGEIGSFTRAASGHLYITLKDTGATLDAVMWRSAAGRLAFSPQEGDKVVARGTLSVYEPRGRYQLVIETMQPVGQGSLQQQFEEMVERLRAEGLFNPEHKKDLPEYPRVIGVATSPTGAAIRDILKVLKKRSPGLLVIVSPCIVQGPEAPAQIISAVQKLERWGGCDIIIVGRGGGSQEDLAAFNDEGVVRTVFHLKTPVVSAVGHEVDISLCDLVADVRAATPTEAAEIVSPDMKHLRERAVHLRKGLTQALCMRLAEDENRIKSLMQSPVLKNPMTMIEERVQRTDDLLERFQDAVTAAVTDREHALQLMATRLEGLSPLGILARGFSVTRTENRNVIKSVHEIKDGTVLRTRLADGEIISIANGQIESAP